MKNTITALLCIFIAASARGTELVATTTTYEITGSVSTMLACDPFTSSLDRYTIGSDAVVRSDRCSVFVLSRFNADNVLVLNACNNYSVVTQFTTGGGSNPQDMVIVDSGRAYVTRYESDLLWIVNPSTGSKLGEINLGSYADDDGIPEMAQMIRVNDRVFVALQNLDRSDFFSPTGESMLVVIDRASDQVIDTIDLQLQNPFWRMRFHPGLGRIVVVSSGAFAVDDGGVELVNPWSLASDSVVLSEATLGGDILDAVIVSDDLGYVLYSNASFQTRMSSFDPSTGALIQTIVSTNGFDLSDLELADEGKLYLSDRRAASSGVRVYDALTGVEIGGGAISMGLPPFDLELVRTDPVAAPSPQPSRRLVAAPTVFSERSQIQLVGARTSSSGLTLDIVDLRGRVVRSLRADAGRRFEWNGRDARHVPVAAGSYFAVLREEPALRAKLTVLR